MVGKGTRFYFTLPGVIFRFDKCGRLSDFHIGEGNYKDTEAAILALLME